MEFSRSDVGRKVRSATGKIGTIVNYDPDDSSLPINVDFDGDGRRWTSSSINTNEAYRVVGVEPDEDETPKFDRTKHKITKVEIKIEIALDDLSKFSETFDILEIVPIAESREV